MIAENIFGYIHTAFFAAFISIITYRTNFPVFRSKVVFTKQAQLPWIEKFMGN